MMFADEESFHFDVEKFWDNDVSTVIQRWADKVGDGEVDKAIENIYVRWEEYATKAGNDTALKIASHICGEAVSLGVLVRQFLFVEIKGGEMEGFLDSVVLEIQEEEQRRAAELEGIQREPAPDAQPPEQEAPKEAGSLTKPPFKCIDELILEGYLADDGRRVLVNLNDVAVRLYKEAVVTKKLLDAYFVKDDGGKYSGSALRDAVNAAHVKPYIKHTDTYIKLTSNIASKDR
jgi:hypothetical protein